MQAPGYCTCHVGQPRPAGSQCTAVPVETPFSSHQSSVIHYPGTLLANLARLRVDVSCVMGSDTSSGTLGTLMRCDNLLKPNTAAPICLLVLCLHQPPRHRLRPVCVRLQFRYTAVPVLPPAGQACSSTIGKDCLGSLGAVYSNSYAFAGPHKDRPLLQVP